MKLEIGKRYKTKTGSIAFIFDSDDYMGFPIFRGVIPGTGTVIYSWHEDGTSLGQGVDLLECID